MRVAVIGGGAAGLACATMIRQMNSNIETVLFEAADRVGRKLLVTGNGQCNITNKNYSLSNYHGSGKNLAYNSINEFTPEMQTDFFRKIGVEIVFENDGKGYPASYQAASVVDCLRFATLEVGVIIKTNSPVENIVRENGGFTLIGKNFNEHFDKLVVACGGVAGGKLGTDKGYSLLKNLGHKIISPLPAIVQLKTENTITKQLKGIKISAKITAFVDNEPKRTEFGEILFCDYGLSGPPVLQLSSIFKGNGTETVSIDLCPETSINDLVNLLKTRKLNLANRNATELLNGLLNKRLGQVLIKLANIKCEFCKDISDNLILQLAEKIKAFDFKVLGNTGFANAQVTMGGADASQVFDNFCSKKAKGLYIIGEVLDVNGDCGGYNLSFAWSSANMAAKSIVDCEKNQQ